MTSPAVTIAPYRSVAAAAREMLDRGINRLPVIRNGSLVGIVSRADLMRAFARSDEEVAADVRDRVEHFLALENDHHTIDVGIDVGEVTVTGRVDRRLTAEALPDVIASIPGVVEVHSELTWVEEASAR
jgi:CBS domain-containing protein